MDGIVAAEARPYCPAARGVQPHAARAPGMLECRRLRETGRGRVAAGGYVVRDDAVRVARELGRLEALADRRRLRVRMLRGLRGALGAGATFLTLIKLKLAGSLALKLALAGLVGLGLAWPITALAVLGVVWLVLSVVLLIVGLFEGNASAHNLSPNCDWPCACGQREKRAARLKTLIERRRTWLADRAGTVPSPRGEATGSVRGATRRR